MTYTLATSLTPAQKREYAKSEKKIIELKPDNSGYYNAEIINKSSTGKDIVLIIPKELLDEIYEKSTKEKITSGARNLSVLISNVISSVLKSPMSSTAIGVIATGAKDAFEKKKDDLESRIAHLTSALLVAFCCYAVGAKLGDLSNYLKENNGVIQITDNAKCKEIEETLNQLTNNKFSEVSGLMEEGNGTRLSDASHSNKSLNSQTVIEMKDLKDEQMHLENNFKVNF